MAAPSKLNGQSARQPFPERAPKPQRMSGDLIVMAALIGISRAFFGSKKEGVVKRTLHGLQETVQEGGRGRSADQPTGILAKGCIAWRVYDGIQNDRVLLV